MSALTHVRRLAQQHVCDAFESACLVSTGAGPLSRPQMLLDPAKDEWLAGVGTLANKHESWEVVDMCTDRRIDM